MSFPYKSAIKSWIWGKNDIGVQSMGSMGTSEVVQVNWLTEAVDVASMSLPQELGGGLRGLRILNNFGRTSEKNG